MTIVRLRAVCLQEMGLNTYPQLHIFVVLSKVYLFRPLFCYQYTEALSLYHPMFPSVPLAFNMPFESQILQALFPH